jgi:aspartate/methionine/tyrosine aminotransferase
MSNTSESKDLLNLKFSRLAGEKNRRRERIFSLGLKEPITETPPQIVEATIAAMKDGYTKYSQPLGLLELRELIRDKLLRENKVDISVDNIVVTPGAKQAMLLTLMAILEPYDEVINITPCYISYIPQIEIAEATSIIHNVDLQRKDFSIDWEKIEALMKRKIKAVILNFPHNPTGSLFSEQDAKTLIEIVSGHDCYIISDEIYDKLVFSDVPSYSLGSFQEISNKVITINGFGKAFSMTGWRIGYLAADDHRIIKTIARLQQHSITHTCTFVQKGACAAFDLPSDYILSYKKELLEKVTFLSRHLASNAKLDLVPPQSGLFAFLDISGSGLTSDEFAYNLLLEKNVALTPGISFGRNWDNHVRISLAAHKDEFEEGVALVDQFTKEL